MMNSIKRMLFESSLHSRIKKSHIFAKRKNCIHSVDLSSVIWFAGVICTLHQNINYNQNAIGANKFEIMSKHESQYPQSVTFCFAKNLTALIICLSFSHIFKRMPS